jgi:DeoR/GlpR family transcriptional regulator of sugar metabolism
VRVWFVLIVLGRFLEEGSSIAHKAPQDRVLAESRRAAIAELLRSSGSVTVAELEQRFAVSPMTARRDLSDLERQGLARRTHGGAVLPAITAHEDSFATRLETETEAKLALAAEAVAMLSPRQSVFLDSSSTAFYVARRIVQEGLAVTVITNSQPVMELVASSGAANLELVGVGGTLRRLTRSFVGPFAIHTVLGHFADRLFLSVKGVTADGTLTDADPLEAEVKRAMIAHADEAVLLVDRSKLAARGLSAIGPVGDLASVIAYGVPAAELAMLRAAGVVVRPTGEAVRP